MYKGQQGIADEICAVMNKERKCEQGVGNSGEDNIPFENDLII